jgi:hypothetical protein
LFNAGDHNPEYPLLDVLGRGASVPPTQIGVTAVKVGVILGLTVMVKVVVVAHCPAVGVNVYTVVAVLFKAGDQIPVMVLFEVVGKADKTPPEQIGLTALNRGVIVVAIVTILLAVQPLLSV